MSCSSAVAASSSQDSKPWFLFHLRLTGEVAEARLRRLGMLLVEATAGKGAELTDAIVDGTHGNATGRVGIMRTHWLYIVISPTADKPGRTRLNPSRLWQQVANF
jgi:hypothetical protein